MKKLIICALAASIASICSADNTYTFANNSPKNIQVRVSLWVDPSITLSNSQTFAKTNRPVQAFELTSGQSIKYAFDADVCLKLLQVEYHYPYGTFGMSTVGNLDLITSKLVRWWAKVALCGEGNTISFGYDGSGKTVSVTANGTVVSSWRFK